MCQLLEKNLRPFEYNFTTNVVKKSTILLTEVVDFCYTSLQTIEDENF